MEPQGRDKMEIVQGIFGLAQDLGNVKKLTDEERRTLKVALSSLESADKEDLTRIETAMKLSRQYTPSSKLGSLIKGVRNILPSWLGGRVSSKSLRALINKKDPEAIFHGVLNEAVSGISGNLGFDFKKFADNLKTGDPEAWDQFLNNAPLYWSENYPKTPTRDDVRARATNTQTPSFKENFTKEVRETLLSIK